jgi:hypothetical protein
VAPLPSDVAVETVELPQSPLTALDLGSNTAARGGSANPKERNPHMRLVSIVIPVLLSLSLAACTTAPGGSTSELGTVQSRLTASELARTKSALRELTIPNISRVDNAAEVREDIQPLVDQLSAYFGKRSAAAKLPLIKGAWHQIWSDFTFPMSPISQMDLAQVYQVVTDKGYYYNLGDSKTLFFFDTSSVLRGEYTQNGSVLDIRFTNVGFRFGGLDKSSNLVSFANALESNQEFYIPIPGGGQAPNGPVGIKGTLETLYADADLRIERGSQAAFRNEAGVEVIPAITNKLFVLERVVTPLK